MTAIMSASLALLAVTLGGLVAFVAYPAALWLNPGRRRSARAAIPPAEPPTVSILIAVRNGAALVADKIRNSLDADYPAERLEVVVASDGSQDDTASIARSHGDPRVRCLEFVEHVGKAEALNRGMDACRGEIVVFSDADARLEPQAVRRLVEAYADPRVGGVCGQRVIGHDDAALKDAQRRYIGFDSVIKRLESRAGRITSNDGKLYSIRRRLFQPIPPAVTDDLYVSLTVVRQGYRFVFEPRARARIRVPSRNPAHEIQRRRRIVSRSLRGIYTMRSLLNPFRYGAYAVGLLVNKVVRRLMPVGLVLLLVSTAVLAVTFPAARLLLAAQAAFYVVALAYPALCRLKIPGGMSRAAAVPFYFCVGNYGMLLGLADFLRGHRIDRWDPRKGE